MPVVLRLAFEAYPASSPAPVLNTVVPPPAPFVIEVLTVDFDVEQTLNIGSQSSGAGAGKVTFNPFSIRKRPDAHSAEFWQRVCSGTPYKKVTLTASRPGATSPFFIFTMGLVAIRTLGISADETTDMTELVTFEYGQASYGAAPQNPDGSMGTLVSTGWDRVKNVQVDAAKVGII